MLQNVWRFVQWMHHCVVHNDIWDVLSIDVSTLRTFHSETYCHVMFRAAGPCVAASLWGDLSERTSLFRNGEMWKASLQELEDFSGLRNVKWLTTSSKEKLYYHKVDCKRCFSIGQKTFPTWVMEEQATARPCRHKMIRLLEIRCIQYWRWKRDSCHNTKLAKHLHLCGQQEQVLLQEVSTPQRPEPHVSTPQESELHLDVSKL